MNKKLLATTALAATIVTVSGTSSAEDFFSKLIDEVDKVKREVIDRTITDFSRIEVKVHNHSNHAVEAALGDEKEIIAPQGNCIFRNKGIADNVIVNFRDPKTGQIIRSEKGGLLKGHMSIHFND